MIKVTPTTNLRLRSVANPIDFSTILEVLQQGKAYIAQDFEYIGEKAGYQWVKFTGLRGERDTYATSFCVAKYVNIEVLNTDDDPVYIPEPEYVADKETLLAAAEFIQGMLVAAERARNAPEALDSAIDILSIIRDTLKQVNHTQILDIAAYVVDILDRDK